MGLGSRSIILFSTIMYDWRRLNRNQLIFCMCDLGIMNRLINYPDKNYWVRVWAQRFGFIYFQTYMIWIDQKFHFEVVSRVRVRVWFKILFYGDLEKQILRT